ncbi:hypothetical protein [Riemerella anatipestifer]|uniref:hypothetical protein n=1 Tax=Riemerella anatipestifer TaxID=34085 RepID=UPI0021F84BE2|nr:hypothetical protein [Riemerella anatipestifer]MCW0518306.1 hypothetical protein [Riemerella anatipestifer]
MLMTKRLTPEDRKALEFWQQYYTNLRQKASVDLSETASDIERRKKRLEANPEEWFKYYFHKYYKCEPAEFHKASTKRITENMEWYEVRAWSRELAKSARAMMEFTYLALTGKKKFIIIASATNESAVRLLKPFKSAFENNSRIIHDYGVQQNHGHWREDQFTIKKGAMFIAVGAGNAPRGARNEEIRPDAIIVDDFDTDEDCRNPDTVDKKWAWFEKALYATRSVSEPLTVLFNGNIIADYCCIKKAIEMADHADIINIRDENGKSTWPAKNSEEHIDRVLSKISAQAVQGEYFNNPINLGKVFKELKYGKIQPLKKYKFLVSYTDPSYKKNGDYKATALVGKYKDEYHIIDMFCQKTSTAKMLEHLYKTEKKTANSGVSVYYYIEYPWIDDTLKREIKKANKRYNITLPLKADERKKPEKFYRIESNLEPLNRNGKLIFNEELKGNEDMKEADFQFLALSPKSRAHDDAPDACEGAIWIINHKNIDGDHRPKVYVKPANKKRY